MYVSLKDVAARAGVSFQTVSKVLKGSNVNLTAETRERVLRAAAELGYVPNAIARGLVPQGSCTIGIIADDLSDWVLAQFVVGAERQARRDGHGVLISIALGASHDAESCIQDLLERRVEGILVAASQLENDEAVGHLLRTRVPAVSLQHVPGGGVPTVGSDHRATGRLATAHLTDLGHRLIGTITGPARRHVVASRLHGYREALAGAGVETDDQLLEESDWSTEGGYRATLRLLEARPRPTAIFAQSDLMASACSARCTNAACGCRRNSRWWGATTCPWPPTRSPP
jgi:LacI family transcriptional regulator